MKAAIILRIMGWGVCLTAVTAFSAPRGGCRGPRRALPQRRP